MKKIDIKSLGFTGLILGNLISLPVLGGKYPLHVPAGLFSVYKLQNDGSGEFWQQ